jgi:hypothetical protein
LTIVIYRIITEFRLIQGVYDVEQKEFDWKWVLPKERNDQGSRLLRRSHVSSRVTRSADPES